MTPYPVIDVKATGENILRRRIEREYTVPIWKAMLMI